MELHNQNWDKALLDPPQQSQFLLQCMKAKCFQDTEAANEVVVRRAESILRIRRTNHASTNLDSELFQRRSR